MNEKKKTKSKGIVPELYFWGQALVSALIFMITVSVFFVRISGVIGPSMMSTLFEKDLILMQIAKYDQPEYKDIIVLRTMATPDEPYVKRIIALAGDVVDFDRSTGGVFVNGALLEEDYINETTQRFGDLEYPFTVPQGCVFVMGDNRNRSSDSRESRVGPVPVEDIVGRVFWRVWPLSSFGAVK